MIKRNLLGLGELIYNLEFGHKLCLFIALLLPFTCTTWSTGCCHICLRFVWSCYNFAFIIIRLFISWNSAIMVYCLYLACIVNQFRKYLVIMIAMSLLFIWFLEYFFRLFASVNSDLIYTFLFVACLVFCVLFWWSSCHRKIYLIWRPKSNSINAVKQNVSLFSQKELPKSIQNQLFCGNLLFLKSGKRSF